MQHDEDFFRSLVYNDVEEYDLVEERVDFDSLYKDYANCQVIVKKKDDSTYWGFDFQSYQSHYGMGGHTFYDCKLYPVERAVETITREYWKKK